jgi:hypothetical protein
MPAEKPVTGFQPAHKTRSGLISVRCATESLDSGARRPGLNHFLRAIFQRFPTKTTLAGARTCSSHRNQSVACRAPLRGNWHRLVRRGSRHVICPLEGARLSKWLLVPEVTELLHAGFPFFQRFSNGALAGRVTTIFSALCYPASKHGLTFRQVEAGHPARRKP